MYLFVLLLLLLAGCASGSNENPSQTLIKSETYKNESSKIRNNIAVQANGVQVEQAFLTYADGTLVSEDNVTNVNKKLLLNLVVSGWEATNGKVHLEASEKVTTDAGEVLLDEPKLFSKSGLQELSADDARYLRLNVVITGVNELADHYNVEFKIWNTYSQQFIYGSYRFFIG